LRSYFTAPLVC